MSVILNDLIDATRKSIHQHSRVKLLVVLLLVLSASLGVVFVVFYIQEQVYLQDEDIVVERRFAPTYDAKSIPCFLVMSRENVKIRDHSLPVVILVHGINGKKEDLLYKALNLAHNGFVAIPIDQRGHGDSQTYSSVGYFEVDDISALIDWISHEVPMANSSNVGLIGESLGGITAYIAQTRDPRVQATVAYNAVSNLTQAIDLLSINNFFSSGREMANNPDSLRVRSPIAHLTPENTKNLLILHGSGDVVVNVSQAYEVYEKVNGSERDDITLIVNPGESHGGNQINATNLKFSILWMRHYLKGEDLRTDRTGLYEESAGVEVEQFQRAPVSALYVLIAWISVVLFLLLARVFMHTDIDPYARPETDLEQLEIDRYKPADPVEKKKVRNILLYIVGFYYVAYLSSGILSIAFKFTIFEAYFIIPVAIGLPLIMIILYRSNAFREPLWEFMNRRMGLGIKDLPLSLFVLLVPFFAYIILADAVSWPLLSQSYNIFNGTFLYYVFIFFVAYFFDLFILRVLSNVKGSKFALFARKHDYLTLAVLKFTTALIFLLYPPSYAYGFPVSVNWLLVVASFSLPLFFIIYIHIYERVSKNLLAAVLLNALVIAAALVRFLFRFV
ncbi:MAG: alpha/beta hydrolase family protein [Promethearchaeota archaeon]